MSAASRRFQLKSCTPGGSTPLNRTVATLVFLLAAFGATISHAFEEEFEPLLNSTCLACHSNEALSLLDFTQLGHDLSDPHVYRKWERIFDRLERGEMPPAPMPTPDAQVLDPAMNALKDALVQANLEKRGPVRTSLRRLTRLEYQYTIEDLLHIDAAAAADLVSILPAEADSGGFDTIAANQGISTLHVRGFMTAAQNALDIALQLGEQPKRQNFVINYKDSQYLQYMSDAKFLGGGITRVLDDGVASYFDTASTYLFHSASEGFNVPVPGQYRVRAAAYPYRAMKPVTLTIYAGQIGAAGTAALSNLLSAHDLVDAEPLEVELTTYLRPNDVIAPSVADVALAPGAFKYFDPEHNVSDYGGEGIVFQSLAIEGPLHDQWPPASTRELLVGIEFEAGQPVLTKDPRAHVREIIAAFAPRAFRRALSAETLEKYAALAYPPLDEGREFLDALRVPLAAILTAPEFLFHTNGSDVLDDFALATRLSYFLWRSMPDDTLLELAKRDTLSEPDTINNQIERMLADPKSDRFIKDFAGQAFRLYELYATTPDAGLYPEYDARLAQAMQAETELFFKELIGANLTIDKLIKADFTFLNRRLADHYGIAEVAGQHMRKVSLPDDNVRGGLLAQAAIHKITANGTTTSPVPRGNFVLSNVLGQPAPPPPPNVAGLEPDTRGTTTIREQLDAHRSNTVCASCHLSIDPPGFAMESFDPVGGFRDRYRASGPKVEVNGETFPGPYKLGMAVDASGTTPEGDAFQSFDEYRALMIEKQLKYVARHFASQLMVLATGAEVQFADRDAINAIVAQVEDEAYPMRSMIHAVALSDLFRRQ